MASLKDKSNKLLLGVVHNRTMADAKNDNRVVDIDTLRQFTIPKMRKAKHELLESVPTSSVQYQREILQVLQQSYQDRKSTDRFIYSQPKLVHNAPLLNEFLEKRKAMRQDRTEKELQDTYGFIAVKTESEAKKYCAEGVTIGNSSMMCLGNPAMGVYLCKHADLLQPSQFFDGQSGYIVIFKIIKGKTKLMVENRVGEALDPTPDFDCHLSKNVNVDLTTVSVQEAYESTQLYVYEYTEDLDVTERPRQVVPHALVSFRFVASGSSQQKLTTAKKVWLPSEYASRQTSSRMSPGAESVLAVNSGLSKRSGADGVTHPAAQRVKNEISVGYDAADNGEIVWTGQLCIESAVISDVELVSYSNLYLPWHLEPWLYLDHDRIGYDEIVKYYELGKLGILPRNQECTASGKFYNYCELRPMNEMSKNFIRAVNFISKSKCGSRIKLTKGVDLIILPHCTITYKLGLCSKRPDQVVLHCIIISTMSSSYQQDTMSKPNEGVSLRPNEIPFNSHVLESGLDIAGTMRHVPSRSLRQSLQFMQAYPSMSPDEQTLLRHGQHGSIPFSPFPAATPGDVVHPLGLSSTADVPFSLSKQRHYDPRLVRRLEMPSEFLPHITSDDVLRLNLPAADLPSALQTGAGEGGCPEQNSTGSGGMRHESLQERIDRMQAEMEARGSPVRYYQSDTDTETEYSASSRFPARGSSSSISEEDEELELDIIKLRRPTALGQLETNTDGEQTNEEAMEVDEGNMADDLVDEIVRMKPLQAKAARETFGEAFEEEKAPDGEPTESVSLTDCLFIDFDLEVETSSDEEVTTDNEKTSADDDLSVIKSVLLTSSSAAKPVHSAVEDESAAEPNEDVANEKDGLSIESSEPVQLVEMSEERPSPKEVPEILSPTYSDVHSNDNLRVPPALSVDVAVSPRPTEENDLNSRIASADEAVNSKGLASPAQPEACLDESSQVVSDTARTVTFVETGKLSIEIHSDAPSTSASAERIAEVATSSHGPKEQIRVVIEEEQLDGCVASVLHRGAKRRCHPPASSEREEEAERQLEMIWRLGLHYLAFFQDGDDDDNREINAEEVPNVRPKTGHTGTFGDTVNREPVHLNNKSKPVGLSSAANKWNRVQQLGICSSTCTTDVARPKTSLSVASRHQSVHPPHNQNESIFSNQELSKSSNSQRGSEISELQLLESRMKRLQQNISDIPLPGDGSNQLRTSLLNLEFVVHPTSERRTSITGKDLKAPKNRRTCNPAPAICKGESALGALQRYCSSSSSSSKSNKHLSSSSSSSSSNSSSRSSSSPGSNCSSSSSSSSSRSSSNSSSSRDSSSGRLKSISKSKDGSKCRNSHSHSNETHLTVNRDQVVSSDAEKCPSVPCKDPPISALLGNHPIGLVRAEHPHLTFSFKLQQTASGDQPASSESLDHHGRSNVQYSTLQQDQSLSRSPGHHNNHHMIIVQSLSSSEDHRSLSGDRRPTTHRGRSLSRSRDNDGEVNDRGSVMKTDRSVSGSRSRKNRDSVVRQGQSFSRSRSRSSVSSSRRSIASYRSKASSIRRTDKKILSRCYRSISSVSSSVHSVSRSLRYASRSVSRHRSRSRSPSTRTSSLTCRSRSRSQRRKSGKSRHRKGRRHNRGRRSSKHDRRRCDSRSRRSRSRSYQSRRSRSRSYRSRCSRSRSYWSRRSWSRSYRSRSLSARYSSDGRYRSNSYDRHRSERTFSSSSPGVGNRNVFRGRLKKRRSRSISSGRQDSYYRYRSNSSYDDESPYQNRTSDYQFRDDRVHPYYRRQDGTRARIDREDFYKVYREHRNIEELLKCLTHSQFESRRTRPILTHLTSSSPVEGSAQSSPRFISRRFQRSTWAEANDTLGRREKVDDCLEDEMFGKDEVPNFYEKKAIAEAFDDNFRPATTESEKSQQRSSSGVSNTPHITSNAVAASETAADGSSDSKPGKTAQMS